MDTLTSFPLLVVFITGVVFLYRLRSPSKVDLDTTPMPKTQTQPQPQIVSKESDFPQDWLTGTRIFDLEKRAIFSKTWLPISHKSRFPKPGTYYSHAIAGFPIILMKGKDHQIRAFHNVCRHRAYPVTSRESGSSTVLGCRYHGWSYNSLGQLIKAPQFEDIAGFEKSQNGLFEIHASTSQGGVIFVNLDAGDVSSQAVVLETQVQSSNGFALRNCLGPGSVWVGGENLEGKFNWKVALSLNWLMRTLDFNHKEPSSSSIIQRALSYLHFQSRKKPDSLYIFPSTFLFTRPSSGCWISLSFIPSSETTTSVRYDLYSDTRMKDKTSQDFMTSLKEELKNLMTELEEEYRSCTLTSDPSYILSSDLDPRVIEAPLDVQSRILTLLREHFKMEKSLRRAIYPARREPRTNERYEQAEQR
ncbi:Rieske [2Fe-2S] iron-sulfur domain-containing protein [Aspergillus californicus]